ncbi:MAG TPA: RNA methyltransferase [Vicinamibacteria bacterium]
MDLRRVEIVLVRPSRPANVAAACRAMKNMGLASLCLVGPPAGLEDREARALAYGAWDVLDGARAAGTLLEAVQGSVAVVGTTGRDVPGAWSPRRLAEDAAGVAAGGTLSVVFGPEASGLTGAELDLCHAVVHVPTDPAHPSLNLAQAVLLLAYELRLAARPAAGGAGPAEAGDRATAGDLEQAMGDLKGALLEIGYLDPASPDRVLAELRRLVARASPTPREVVLLRGLARQMAWAGRVARGRAGAG